MHFNRVCDYQCLSARNLFRTYPQACRQRPLFRAPWNPQSTSKFVRVQIDCHGEVVHKQMHFLALSRHLSNTRFGVLDLLLLFIFVNCVHRGNCQAGHNCSLKSPNTQKSCTSEKRIKGLPSEVSWACKSAREANP